MKNLNFVVSLCLSFFAIVSGATTDESKIQFTVSGGDTGSFTPSPIGLKQVKDPTKYDVIIVGAGLAGLTSAVYLTDHNKRVLLLEKEAQVGGLASGGVSNDGIKFDRGAAYWTDPYPEEQEILNRIGLGDYEKWAAIPEPADTYFLNGKLYPGIWEEKTMKQLPVSFPLFKYELKKENDEGLIPNQPLEEGPTDLDRMSAADWINAMPARMQARRKTDPKAAKIMRRFYKKLGTKSLEGIFGMGDVIKLMDLYCRSALGANADGVSALAFANFYISEIETRYTTPYGTAQAAINMASILEKRGSLIQVQTSSPVSRIWDEPQGVRVVYINNNTVHEVEGAYLVFAAQVKLAPTLIDGFAEKAQEKAKVINDLEYADYSVHTVNMQGTPYRLSYDTWTHSQDYSEKDFTDVILAPWVETQGYKKYKNYSKEPPGQGIMTIYHPLSPQWNLEKYSDSEAIAIARYAVHRLLEIYGPMLKENYHTEMDITSVQTNRWPISVHIARPGHFLEKAKVLREPFGHIYFGNNNMGTPAFEEALFRGHCAADNVLIHLDSSFNMAKEEPWTLCPLEK